MYPPLPTEPRPPFHYRIAPHRRTCEARNNPGLATGWESAMDPASGNSYFFHRTPQPTAEEHEEMVWGTRKAVWEQRIQEQRSPPPISQLYLNTANRFDPLREEHGYDSEGCDDIESGDEVGKSGGDVGGSVVLGMVT